MNREEFTELTGVEISHRYYTERIEPDYADGEWADKQEFCAQWVKNNKANICKTSAIDLSGLHRDIANYECMKTRLEKGAEELAEAKNKIESLKITLETTIRHRDDAEQRANAHLENQEHNAIQICDLQLEVKDLTEALAASQQEITTLKAKLYDLMCAGA